MPALNILMRFLHIISAVTLLGGVLAWRFGVLPAIAPLAPETRTKVDKATAAAWRPWVFFSIGGLLVSGLYNYMVKTSAGVKPAWHAVIGVKFLLALHVLGVMFIASAPNNQKRTRQLTGVVASGVLIVALSAVLRWISAQ